jgi:hypothetical protein
MNWLIALFMVFPVYLFVWNFHSWYIGNEVGLLGFSYTYGVFMMGILLYLMGGTMIIVLGWEGIRLMSILLIGY